ncbi:hypothetical protein [Polaribacter sp.]
MKIKIKIEIGKTTNEANFKSNLNPKKKAFFNSDETNPDVSSAKK